MGSRWEPLVWGDVVAFHPELDQDEYSLHAIRQQLYDDALSDNDKWPNVRATFDVLRIFYNAVGFADMIVTARIAVQENPDLITQSHWIFDEYQDFNTAEDRLVETVTAGATAVLLAGDDDQALYQQLKRSHPEIIKNYYEHAAFAKAMLPYCSRCGYYVCLAASAFIDQHRRRHRKDLRAIGTGSGRRQGPGRRGFNSEQRSRLRRGFHRDPSRGTRSTSGCHAGGQ